MIQCLGLRDFTAEDPGSISGWGTKIPQAESSIAHTYTCMCIRVCLYILLCVYMYVPIHVRLILTLCLFFSLWHMLLMSCSEIITKPNNVKIFSCALRVL